MKIVLRQNSNDVFRGVVIGTVVGGAFGKSTPWAGRREREGLTDG